MPFTSDTARKAQQAAAASRARNRSAQVGKGAQLHDPDAQADKPPAGRGAASPTPSRSRRRSASLKDQIAGLLMFANAPLRIASPADVLKPQEIEQLAQALAEDPWTATPLAKIGKASPHMALFTAIITIAVPRLAMRGIIPGGLAGDMAGIGQAFGPGPFAGGGSYDDDDAGGSPGGFPFPFPFAGADPAPVPVEAGGAYGAGGGDGHGQVDTGGIPAAGA